MQHHQGLRRSCLLHCNRLLSCSPPLSREEPGVLVSSPPKAVIRSPLPLQRKALKRSSKVLFGRMDRFEGERDRPVILCRRTELNHYYRQTYSKVDRVPLASEHWQSRRTHGDFFTFMPWGSPEQRGKKVRQKTGVCSRRKAYVPYSSQLII